MIPIWISAAPIFGCAVIATVTALRFFLVPSDQKRCEWLILVTLLDVPFGLSSQHIVVALSSIRPWKYDYLVFYADGLLGFQPSLVVAQALSHSRCLLIASALAYVTAIVWPVIIFGAY